MAAATREGGGKDRPAAGGRAWRRAAVAGGGAAALLTAAGAVAWYYAERITEPPHRRPRLPEPADAVTLVRMQDAHAVLAGADAGRPGWWGVDLGDAYLRVGPGMPRDGDEVVRPTDLVVGDVRTDTPGRLDSDAVPPHPRQLGLPASDEAIPGPLGELPAWWIPAAGHTAAIVIHGRRGTRREGLRWVPALHAAGVAALVMSYRNDPEGPPSPDGRSHLGATEWADIEAGLAWLLATQEQVDDVLLLGVSMGAACAAELLGRSDLSGHVRGLILDAPVRNWGPVLRAAAAARGIPPAVLPVLVRPSMALAGARSDIDWRSLDHLEDPSGFQLPTLLFHGDADRVVPVELSDAFAAQRADVVTYHRVPGAGHVQAWNVDRDGCETALRAWLTTIAA